MSRIVGAALAVGLFIGGTAEVRAAFLPYVDYYAASISEYTGQEPSTGLTQLAAGTSDVFTISVFNQLELTIFGINGDTSVCATGFGCASGSEVDTSKNYFVDVDDGKGGPSSTTITLSAGSGPISFAEQVAPAPLPASLPMFGTALLSLGALTWRKRLRRA